MRSCQHLILGTEDDRGTVQSRLVSMTSAIEQRALRRQRLAPTR